MAAEIQVNHATCLDRYPEIFEEARRRLPGRRRVLSFGCSTGEEVRSLRLAGEGEWEVHGLEVKPDLVAKARAADPGGVYATSADALPGGAYDAVFCMSVLCRFPDGAETFSFADFARACAFVDRLVLPGGYLVINNAQYDFRATIHAARLYTAVRTPELDPGFVPRMTKAGRPLRGQPPVFYQKRGA